MAITETDRSARRDRDGFPVVTLTYGCGHTTICYTRTHAVDRNRATDGVCGACYVPSRPAWDGRASGSLGQPYFAETG